MMPIHKSPSLKISVHTHLCDSERTFAILVSLNSVYHLSVTALFRIIWRQLHRAAVGHIYLFPLRAQAVSPGALHR